MQTIMEEEEQKPPFRFSTKKQYEEAITSLLNTKPKKRSSREEEYEELVEEYLRFCSQD